MLHALLLASTSATVPDVIVFAASAVVILMGAVGVVTSSNPVHAALSPAFGDRAPSVGFLCEDTLTLATETIGFRGQAP